MFALAAQGFVAGKFDGLLAVALEYGQADGEMAAWIDGTLYLHLTGFRWRTTADLRLKRVSLDVYVHSSEQTNTVWYDDIALSTGYVGPMEEGDHE